MTAALRPRALARRERLAAAALGALGAGLALAASPWWAPVALAPPLFVAWFFRDPARTPPPDADAALAPADGVVDDVRHEPACPFFGGPAWRVGIYLGLLDVHVQRAPCAAIAERAEHRRGRRVATARVGRTDANEQFVTWLRRADGRAVVVRQLAGPLTRGLVNVLTRGDALAAGQRFGLIRFGSRCELWLPADPGVALVARTGQRVRAGETIVARVTPAGVASPGSPVPPAPARHLPTARS